MVSGAYLRSCAAATAAALGIGLLVWGSIFLGTSRGQTRLTFPLDTPLRATVRFGVTYDESHQARGTLSRHTGSWECHVVLVGSPQPIGNATQYTLTCEAFDLFRLSQSVPDLRFRREKETAPDGVEQLRNHYTLNEALAPSARAALLKAFHIDTSTDELAADTSLTLEALTLTIGHSGTIKEVILSEPLRNALLMATAGIQGGPLIRDALNKTEQFPPLLAKTQKRVWETAGRLFLPIAMRHTAVKEGDSWTIASQSVGGTGRLPFLSGKMLSENQWALTTTLDADNRPQQIEATGTLAVGDTFLQSPDRRRYHVVINAAVEYIGREGERVTQ